MSVIQNTNCAKLTVNWIVNTFVIFKVWLKVIILLFENIQVRKSGNLCQKV